MITVQAINALDTRWLQLREALWPQCSATEHRREAMEQLAQPQRCLTVLALDGNGQAIGFAEGTIRHDYVNGTESSPVGFLEGIYVASEYRRQGNAALLITALTDWFRQNGCQEMASDVEQGNQISLLAHQALGFEETERVVYFRKRLD